MKLTCGICRKIIFTELSDGHPICVCAPCIYKKINTAKSGDTHFGLTHIEFEKNLRSLAAKEILHIYYDENK